MGKGHVATKGKRKSSTKVDPSRLIGDKHRHDAQPHSTDADFVHGDADRWDNQRVTRAMQGTTIDGLDGETGSMRPQKEVMRVRVDSSSSDDERFEREVASDSDSDGVHVDLDDQDEEDAETRPLPSAASWGRKKSVLYSTDYQGDEYGGMSGSDEEAAELEENDAMDMQRRLAEEMHGVQDDFLVEAALDDVVVDDDSPTTKTSIKEVDVATLTTAVDRLEYVKAVLPEIPALCDELNRRQQMTMTVLRPILDWRKKNELADRPSFANLQSVVEIYSNYCVNIRYYLWYVQRLAKGGRLDKLREASRHPVIERIMQWKKLCDHADKMMDRYADEIETLLDKIEAGESLAEIETCLVDAPLPGDKGMMKTSKKAMKKHMEEEDMEAYYGVNGEVDPEAESRPTNFEALDEETRRAIDYQIAKNRGLTPHKSKKYNKHSRVKRKHKYEKLTTKRRSQVPDVRRETTRYDGEKHGIKPYTVKSIKFKQ